RLVVDAVDAERALAHLARQRVHLARAVGAGPGAEPAADAVVPVHQHDPVPGALVAGAGRADGDAGGRLAMQAGAREVHDPGGAVPGGDLVAVDAVEERPARLRSPGIRVRQRAAGAAVVPALAGGDAGMAADAGVEV